ncbi:ATP-dependent DNA helicase [Pseudactinotalea terrae]|uniref:ATP-dependent DNA helicase n=1 Tax=Pseudactinotalea terrae TaxID=1743262 RepID=UPI0012E18ED5|nr:ATP-dependent DNA helicase [Pseudactinotalea terrae]
MSEPDVQKVLTDAVRKATGLPHARPRPGQDELTQQVWEALTATGGEVVATAPTGLGKSMAYGVPAMLLNATTGKRVVISTESLALQAQIVDKDAPVAAAAVRDATGVVVRTAVLKGWSNYTCLRTTLSSAHELLGQAFEPGEHVPTDDDLRALTSQLLPMVAATDTVELGGGRYPHGEAAQLVVWALQQHLSETGGTGDKHSYSGSTANGAWDLVSVTPNECVGMDQCPFASVCKPAMAKQRAADADVVVTNHALLATQAAKSIGAVIGSKKLGRFDAIIVDEAHALPDQVRNQGASEVASRRILSTTRALRTVLEEADPTVKTLLSDGQSIAEAVEAELAAQMGKADKSSGVVRLGKEDDPILGSGVMLEAWLTRAQTVLAKVAKKAAGDAEVRVRRVRARVDSLKADMSSVCEHRTGVARWVEADDRGERITHAARSTPVDVSSMLQSNLWSAPEDDPDAIEAAAAAEDQDGPQDLSADPPLRGADGKPRYKLSVVTVSATLPRGFPAQVGLRTQTTKYASPFRDAYRESVLFIPRADDPAAIAALSRDPGRPRLDVGMHREWAKALMVALVEANQGHALILSATAAAGREYAQALRTAAANRWAVHSQWDGPALRHLTGRWKDDVPSVMVGTRSMMTGVDAPGSTCSLVVIDRVPRSPANPVDDARVEDLMERADMDRWAATRLIYSASASLLLEQGSGRLIRSERDRGMVALLDPRMLKLKPFGYPEATRAVYKEAVAMFGQLMTRPQEATAWLRQQQAQLAAAA